MKNNLGSIRYERDITLRALARRCGVSVGHLSKLENGYCDPTVPVAYAICRALHLSIYIVFPDQTGGEENIIDNGNTCAV